jgi:hypothetical protein
VLERDAQPLGKLDNAGYFLAGTKRQFDIALTAPMAGTALLKLDLDDGSSPSFELKLR